MCICLLYLDTSIIYIYVNERVHTVFCFSAIHAAQVDIHYCCDAVCVIIYSKHNLNAVLI